MEPVKRKQGRPKGAAYPRRLPVYDMEEGIALLQELARRRGTSAAALVRQLVRDEAVRAGIAPLVAVDPDKQAAARDRFRQLVEKARTGPVEQLTPQEIEREAALARTEVHENRSQWAAIGTRDRSEEKLMQNATLREVLAAVRALTREEQARLRVQLDAMLTEPEAGSPEAEVERALFGRGLLSEIKNPITDLSAYRNRRLVHIKGKPLSETVIEERR